MTLNKYNEIMENVKVTEDMRKRILDNVEKEASLSSDKADSVPNNKKSGTKIVHFRQYGKIAAALALLVAGFGISSLVLDRFGVKNMETSAPASDSAMEYAMEATESAEAPEVYEEMDSAESTGMYNDTNIKTESIEGEAVLESADNSKAESISDYAEESEAATEEPMEEAAAEFAAEDSASGSDSRKSDKDALTVDAIREVTEYTSAKELSSESGIEIADISSLKDASDESIYTYYYNLDMVEIMYLIDGDKITYRKSPSQTGTMLTGNYKKYDLIETINNNDITYTLEGKDGLYFQATWTKEDANYSLYSEAGKSLNDFEKLLSEY